MSRRLVRRWTAEQRRQLIHLSRVKGWAMSAVASYLNRSEDSCKAQLGKLEGRRKTTYVRSSRAKPADAPRDYSKPDWGEPPPRVRTNHLKHCLAVVRANRGCGFPVVEIPALKRVA